MTDGWKNWGGRETSAWGTGGQNGLGPTKLQSQVKGEQEREVRSSEPRLFQTHTYPLLVKLNAVNRKDICQSTPSKTSTDALRLRCQKQTFTKSPPGFNLVLGLLRKHRQKEAWRSSDTRTTSTWAAPLCRHGLRVMGPMGPEPCTALVTVSPTVVPGS